MTLYDQINAINAEQMRNPLGPLVQIGQNNAEFEAYQLQQRDALAAEARHNFYAQQAADRNQQFQVKQADLAFKRQQAGKVMDESRGLRSQLEELGGNPAPEASTFEMRNAIQDRLGQGVQALYKQLAPLGNDIMTEGGHSPEETQKRISTMIASHPDFSKVLNDYPDVLKGLANGTFALKDIPAALQEKPSWKWYHETDETKKQRQIAFSRAIIEAENKLADEEQQAALKGPDFRKTPLYLDKINRYKALNTQLHGLLTRLQDPERIQGALNFMNPSRGYSGGQSRGRYDPFGLPPTGAVGTAVQTAPASGVNVGVPGRAQIMAARVANPSQVPVVATTADRVYKLIPTIPTAFREFFPAQTRQAVRNTMGKNPLTDQQASEALGQYAANLRAEIARLAAFGSRQRGLESRIEPLRAELARISK